MEGRTLSHRTVPPFENAWEVDDRCKTELCCSWPRLVMKKVVCQARNNTRWGIIRNHANVAVQLAAPNERPWPQGTAPCTTIAHTLYRACANLRFRTLSAVRLKGRMMRMRQGADGPETPLNKAPGAPPNNIGRRPPKTNIDWVKGPRHLAGMAKARRPSRGECRKFGAKWLRQDTGGGKEGEQCAPA